MLLRPPRDRALTDDALVIQTGAPTACLDSTGEKVGEARKPQKRARETRARAMIQGRFPKSTALWRATTLDDRARAGFRKVVGAGSLVDSPRSPTVASVVVFSAG